MFILRALLIISAIMNVLLMLFLFIVDIAFPTINTKLVIVLCAVAIIYSLFNAIKIAFPAQNAPRFAKNSLMKFFFYILLPFIIFLILTPFL